MTETVVVDDSRFMRTAIGTILEDAGFEVVAEAENGRAAVDAVGRHRPDLVTMDVEMPEMNGIEAVEAIMETRPTPILMLSAHTRADADATFDALDRGAVDFFPKPSGEISASISTKRGELVRKARAVAGAQVTGTDGPRAPRTTADHSLVPDHSATVVIGASTGGPKVVEQVVAELPSAASLKLLVVQHMPEAFTSAFAERLDGVSEYDIDEASETDDLYPGQGLVARGDYHMHVTEETNDMLSISLNKGEEVHSVRPAIDVTMESAASVISGDLIGVILTGMGRDGAAGLEQIKRAGGRTLVQDEETSRVFGMPLRAIERGAADEVVPRDAISGSILELVGGEGS